MGRKLHLRSLTCLFQIKWMFGICGSGCKVEREGSTHTHTAVKSSVQWEKKNCTTNSGEWWTQAVYMLLLFDTTWARRLKPKGLQESRLKRCMRSWVYGAHTHSHNKHKIPLNIMNRMVSMVVHSFQFDFCNGYSGPKANRPKRSTIRSRLSHGTFHFIKCECA